jgi:Beta-galactosidase
MLLAAGFQAFTKSWTVFSLLGHSLFFVILSLSFLLSVSEAHADGLPSGVYSLTPAGKPVNAAILTNPNVSGVSIREQWQDVEQLEGIYNWSYFDQQIIRAENARKKVLLRIPSGGENTPQWVFDAGVQTFSFVDTNRYHDTYNQTLTIPVFWNQIFLQKKKKFIKAMGAHFATNPNIVLVGTDCANATSDDWNVPSTPVDVQNWQAIGYTSDKLINACKEIIDATMAAFPGQFVLLAVGRNGQNLDPNPDYVARHVVKYGHTMYPGRLIVQKNSLSTNTPDPSILPSLGAWQIIFDNQPDVAGQMLWFATDDPKCRLNGGVKPCDPVPVLHEVVRLGALYGMRYEEIYQKDILNPDLAGVIGYAAKLLAPDEP